MVTDGKASTFLTARWRTRGGDHRHPCRPLDDGACWLMGCLDPTSATYDIGAHFHLDAFCSYPTSVHGGPLRSGCMDSMAFHYSSLAEIHLEAECVYPHIMDNVAVRLQHSPHSLLVSYSCNSILSHSKAFKMRSIHFMQHSIQIRWLSHTRDSQHTITAAYGSIRMRCI